MPTASTSATKRSKPRKTRRTSRRDPLAITLLKTDHREVEGWFDEYEQLDAEGEKQALFNKIALALKVHTQIEEEIFYPEERGEVEDDMLDEAYVEHDGAKKLIAEIEAVRPQVIVCLGATAAQSLLGTTFRVSTQRGQQLRLPSSTGVHVMPEPIVVATVHPSSVLRDRSDHRDEVYKSFVDDLRSAGAGLATRE